ncbi:hypothetical protein ABZ085_31495, partial [Streptomyces albidoflavus]|uniref:hypothetical protein n=1 Tax=Streptomyces albidoflavus TaxID=1886 RepID=UPI0033A7F4FE
MGVVEPQVAEGLRDGFRHGERRNREPALGGGQFGLRAGQLRVQRHMGDRVHPGPAGGADHGLQRLPGERPGCSRHLCGDLDVVHALLPRSATKAGASSGPASRLLSGKCGMRDW